MSRRSKRRKEAASLKQPKEGAHSAARARLPKPETLLVGMVSLIACGIVVGLVLHVWFPQEYNQRLISHYILKAIVVTLVTMVAHFRKKVWSVVVKFWYEPTSPYDLAVFRIIVFGYFFNSGLLFDAQNSTPVVDCRAS